jgi:hypothetical protein
MRLAAPVCAVVLLSGCGTLGVGSRAEVNEAPAGLSYTVQPASALPGGSATVTLHNGTGEPVGYNLCVGALERHGGGLWVPALSAANGCPPDRYTLEPGQQASAEALLPPGLEAGDYRFVTTVDAPAGSWPLTQIRSDSFSIPEPQG